MEAVRSMARTVWQYLACIAAAIAFSGCGGGGGLGLSGGSIPVGGRVVTGTALLPDGSAVANAQVTVQTIPSGSTIATATTDQTGKFTVQNVPTDSDVSVIVSQPPTNTLQTVVSRSSLMMNPAQTLDIGSVTAITTLVAACIHQEHAPAPEDADSIVMTQQGDLTMEAHDANYSVDAQQQFIQDPASLMAQALSLIVPAANTELETFNASPNTENASTVIDGLLAYVRAAHQRNVHLGNKNRKTLIDSVLAGTTYTPQKVAAALKAAGVKHVTDVQVTAASERERTELPAIGGATSDLSAFEVLVISADVNTHGGFQLDQKGFEAFLAALSS
jgi:hypothetical protein